MPRGLSCVCVGRLCYVAYTKIVLSMQCIKLVVYWCNINEHYDIQIKGISNINKFSMLTDYKGVTFFYRNTIFNA